LFHPENRPKVNCGDRLHQRHEMRAIQYNNAQDRGTCIQNHFICAYVLVSDHGITFTKARTQEFELLSQLWIINFGIFLEACTAFRISGPKLLTLSFVCEVIYAGQRCSKGSQLWTYPAHTYMLSTGFMLCQPVSGHM
jgi:hypothetical protein